MPFYNLFRTCLRYFLPPQWIMDKDAVSNLNVTELAGFPLDDFFDHYEKGLRKVRIQSTWVCDCCEEIGLEALFSAFALP